MFAKFDNTPLPDSVARKMVPTGAVALGVGIGIATFTLICVGGALYTAGGVIYGFKRPNPWPRWFGFHEVFHAFVIAAAICHFTAIAGWVVPA